MWQLGHPQFGGRLFPKAGGNGKFGPVCREYATFLSFLGVCIGWILLYFAAKTISN
jgi:hypothetical protein